MHKRALWRPHREWFGTRWQQRVYSLTMMQHRCRAQLNCASCQAQSHFYLQFSPAMPCCCLRTWAHPSPAGFGGRCTREGYQAVKRTDSPSPWELAITERPQQAPAVTVLHKWSRLGTCDDQSPAGFGTGKTKPSSHTPYWGLFGHLSL